MTEAVIERLTDFAQLYEGYQHNKLLAKQLLQSQDRYLSRLSFDPLTGEAQNQRMSSWLIADTGQLQENQLHDRFTHLLNHCIGAIGQILLQPRQTVVRVHQMTPVYLAQKLDSRSVQWLSRQPGRNMREKLAANPHILAATRKMSYDTLENRLVKALLRRIEWLLLSRKEAGFQLTEEHHGLLESIQQTLLLDEFIAVKPWQNMPPNNVLLQDKQYRKVWQAWQWLQRLEEDCQHQQDTFIAAGFGVYSELLRQLADTSRTVLLDQAWQFRLDELTALSSTEPADNVAPLKVTAIDVGTSGFKENARVMLRAKLDCSLFPDGRINILRQESSGKQQSWELRFQHRTDRLITISIISSNGDTRKGRQAKPIVAMPADYPRLVSEIITGVLPGNIRQRAPLPPLTKVTADFATLMFEGASCKLQHGSGSSSRWLAPQYIDADGLDCSQSSGLSANEVVYSCKELVLPNGSSKGLAEQIAQQVTATKGMHYLVCDHHSDFETVNLRSEINRNFNKAAPLPKSIAAVFSSLNRQQFKRNDLVMVLSSDCDGVYATPVYYRWGNKPGEEYLERYPSIRLSRKGERQFLLNALMKVGLSENIAQRFIDLYSYREITTNKAHLLLQDGEHWYRVPTGLKVDCFDVSNKLQKEVSALQSRKDKVYFISVSAAIKPQKGIKSSQWLLGDPLSGSQTLLRKKHIEPEKTFWKDHLPQLMTRLPVNGIEQDFFFVNDQTSVKPERGVAVSIPIGTPFTFPSGKEELNLTVHQGKGSHRQSFSLLLPLRQALKEDCLCELTLSYTYGEEQPYKLRFAPHKNAKDHAFNYVDAQWGPKKKQMDNRKAATPVFPEQIVFEELKSYQGKKGSSDIIEWIERNLEQLAEIYSFILSGQNKQRFNFAYRDINWIPQKEFGFYNSHPNYDSIFVHQNQFEALDIENQEFFSGDVISKKDNKYSLVNICYQGELSEYEQSSLSKRWRFPMLTFSDQGRSFSDVDLPEEFARKGKQAIKQAQELMAILSGSSPTLDRELKQFLSYCHKLMPATHVDHLLQTVTDKYQLRKEPMKFMYALGDVSQPWQQQLLTQLLQPIDGSGGTRAVTLEILSVAMWRHQSVIHQLNAEQVSSLTHRLNDSLLNEINKLKKQDKFFKWNAFILRLELLLALLRTRESEDPEVCKLFAYDSELCVLMRETIKQVTNKQGVALADQLSQPKIVSRVKLSVDKPAAYYRTPDLLYALKLYLSGEDGADQIMITELMNSD